MQSLGSLKSLLWDAPLLSEPSTLCCLTPLGVASASSFHLCPLGLIFSVCNAIALRTQHSLFTDKTGSSFHSYMHMWGIYYNNIFFLLINLSFFLTYTLETWVFRECCHSKKNGLIWSCRGELVSRKKKKKKKHLEYKLVETLKRILTNCWRPIVYQHDNEISRRCHLKDALHFH